MAAWATFTGIVGVILVLLLLLARASAAVVSDTVDSTGDTVGSAEQSSSAKQSSSGEQSASTKQLSSAEQSTGSGDHVVDWSSETPVSQAGESTDGSPAETAVRNGERASEPPAELVDGSDIRNDEHRVGEGSVDTDREATPAVGPPPQPRDDQSVALSTGALLANVVLSQGLFGLLLVTMAWYTEIPAWAFGLSAELLTLGEVGTGIVVGGVFYGCNEVAAAVGRRQGIATPTELREALAPETAAGWCVLLVVVLPVIAGFEELLFRGALIGVVHAGFGVSPWLLAVGSSVAFALGHGAQGRLGIVVTGLLGAGLAAVFIQTGSLLVVIVAHYVINGLEFVVHEGLELA